MAEFCLQSLPIGGDHLTGKTPYPEALSVSSFGLPPSPSMMTEYMDGAALAAKKASKLRQHDQHCRDADISFMPLVVMALGGWDTDALVHLRELASAAAKRNGDHPSSTTRHFFQRLSVKISSPLLAPQLA